MNVTTTIEDRMNSRLDSSKVKRLKSENRNLKQAKHSQSVKAGTSKKKGTEEYGSPQKKKQTKTSIKAIRHKE